MKKFLRRALGTLALFGTACGGKFAASEAKGDPVDKEISVKSNADIGCGLLFGEPTKQWYQRQKKIFGIFKNTMTEATKALNSSRFVSSGITKKNLEIVLPSEKKSYQYRLSDLPADKDEALIKVYSTLIKHVISSRVTKLQDKKNLSNEEREKIKYYHEITPEYIQYAKKTILNYAKKNLKKNIWEDGERTSLASLGRSVGGIFRESFYRPVRDFS